MSDHDKITAMHLRRAAFVYIRQSTATQSSTTGNQRRANTPSPIARWNWVGGGTRSPSLTRISAFLEPARRNVPALPN
jgi:hypothetical protein